jgi:ABC-2 type transport system ATP-binding protein
MSYILQTNHLTKIIDGKELVTDVNIHVEKGEIYGFLGPNGAGKTTVMKMITNQRNC